jgi:uracil phosphoribosyltransferase
MAQVKILKHPILQHLLSELRNKDTNHHDFRRNLAEISRFMAYELTKDLDLKSVEFETPLEKGLFPSLAEEVLLVSILRAGNGMLEPMLDAVPNSRAGHIGLKREDHGNTTIQYYLNMPPNAKGMKTIIVDPMVATGGSVLNAVSRLKEIGVGEIKFSCLLISQHAIDLLEQQHPDVEVYTLAIERELDERNYLLPGLGDAGDRVYGTY